MKRFIETWEFTEDVLWKDEVIFKKGERISDPRMVHTNASGDPIVHTDQMTHILLMTDRMEKHTRNGRISFPKETLKYIEHYLHHGS